jgi:MFS family permease
MWLLPLSFFTYQFILRLWPSLMMQPIMQQFAIDATSFGFLASAYYYGYAGMQIPIAVMLDRYGAKRIVFACAVLCGLATLVFTYTDNWYLSLLSRFMIGAGSAVGFLGTSKVVSEWFSNEKYAKMIGLSFTVGLLGAIYGGKPVSLLVESFGGTKVALTLGLVAIGIGFTTLVFLRKPPEEGVATETMSFGGFKSLLSGPSLWMLGAANFLMVGALDGFADVWGVNFLQTAYNLPKSEAAFLISFIFVGMVFGGPLLALFARRSGNYTVISFCGLGMALLFCLLVLFPSSFNWYTLAFLFFAVGLLCCYQVIVFAAGSELVSIGLLGVTVAFLNCLNMLGGSFFHTFIGSLMDLFWTGGMAEGVRIYSLESYSKALLLIPVCASLGAVIAAALKWRQGKNLVAVRE